MPNPNKNPHYLIYLYKFQLSKSVDDNWALWLRLGVVNYNSHKVQTYCKTAFTTYHFVQLRLRRLASTKLRFNYKANSIFFFEMLIQA